MHVDLLRGSLNALIEATSPLLPPTAIFTPCSSSLHVLAMQGPSSAINTLRPLLAVPSQKERSEMTARTTVIAAMLATALLAVAGVSGFRATITAIIDEELDQDAGEQQQTQHKCRQQIRPQRLQQCRQFLQQQSQESPYEPVLLNQEEKQQQPLWQCCQQLKNVDEQCRCEAVKQVVQQLQQGEGPYGQQGPQKQQQILQKARQLPGLCNLQPKECQIQPPLPYPYYYIRILILISSPR